MSLEAHDTAIRLKNWWPFFQPGVDIICHLESLNGWGPVNTKNLLLFWCHTLPLMESVKTPCSVSHWYKTNQWTEAIPILESQCWKQLPSGKSSRGWEGQWTLLGMILSVGYFWLLMCFFSLSGKLLLNWYNFNFIKNTDLSSATCVFLW